LQDLGHTVVVIVGDWTARIGDPSGQSKTRPMLTAEQVRENAETYLRQFSKIVDRELTEIRWQSEWFDEFTLTTVVSLAAKFTVNQMLKREDFAQRFNAQKPVGVHELFYPLLQAYDSVAVQADVEFGGTDQTFNLLVGRELQPEFGQKPQAVFTVPLLVGTDGVKMSKSQGNYVALEEPPHEMYGKLMSITDLLVGDYFELLTDEADVAIAEIREAVAKGGARARDAKMRLAREIVGQYHGAEAAEAAEAEFRRVFSERAAPEEAAEFAVSFNGASHIEVDLMEALVQSGVAASKSEVRRLVEQGAVEAGGERVDEPRVRVGKDTVIRVGKHRFLRIVDLPGN
jgi:tyrosyl-tRNA synthetase